MDVQQLQAARQQMVLDNAAEYGNSADPLNWITPEAAAAAETERGQRLSTLAGSLQLAFKATKPHLGPDVAGTGRRVTQQAGF